MKSKRSDKDYNDLTEELDAIIARLQAGDVSLDDSLAQYEKGLDIVKDLEFRLREVENRIKEIKLQKKDDIKN